jgi:hypothetical protein
MIYARVHDQTVAEDYYEAMNRVEERLELVDQPVEITPYIIQPRLVLLVEQLFTPFLAEDTRINIASQLKEMIGNDGLSQVVQSKVGGIPP